MVSVAVRMVLAVGAVCLIVFVVWPALHTNQLHVECLKAEVAVIHAGAPESERAPFLGTLGRDDRIRLDVRQFWAGQADRVWVVLWSDGSRVVLSGDNPDGPVGERWSTPLRLPDGRPLDGAVVSGWSDRVRVVLTARALRRGDGTVMVQVIASSDMLDEAQVEPLIGSAALPSYVPVHRGQIYLENHGAVLVAVPELVTVAASP